MSDLLKRDPYEPGDCAPFGPFTTHEGVTITPQPDTGIRFNSRREAVIANAAHNAALDAVDEAARRASETPAMPHGTDGNGFTVEHYEDEVLLYPQSDGDMATAEFALGPTFTAALAATQEAE